MAEVTLRDVEDDDLPVLFEHQRDPEAAAMAAFPSREWDAFHAHWTRIRANPAGRTLAIVYDGRVVGNFVSWKHDDGRRIVAYWIGREFWGRGIATSALAAYLAEEPERPLYAYVVRHNAASRRVLEKCGFVLAGENAEEFDLVLR